MSILAKLSSKITLYKILMSSKIYTIKRKRFRDYYDQKDRNFAIEYCKELEPIIKEAEHFYLKVSPTHVSLIERKEKELLDDVSLTYGETTWKTVINIAEELDIKKHDIFYDLGCGSGKLVFLINKKYGCKTNGIDLIENFIKISNIICNNLNLKGVKFFNQDFMKKDINDGTIFYITATCFDEEFLDKIMFKLKRIKKDAIVITITRPLECEHLELYKTKICDFSWAKDTVYFHKKI